jgi:3-phenylpropionate/cinnamic acid dioxygenase small subunit
MGAADLRRAVEELNADYAACLNEGRFDDWLAFFVEGCVYKIIPRENWERGLPLATWHSESRGYLADRIVAIRKTAVYGPRTIRRLVSGTRVLGWGDGVLATRADYAAFETLPDELTRVFNVGEYRDRIVAEDGRLKFLERLCVFDSVLVPNSLIYPL